jgi:hypothetical protein
VKVLFWHTDGKLPNLAGMRIVAHHRALGDEVTVRKVSKRTALTSAAFREVEPRFDDPTWDRVYASAIFDRTAPLIARIEQIYPGCIVGGTGTANMGRTLADVGIKDGPVDYADYPEWEQSIGFAMRGCRFKCDFCVVPRKEGRARENDTIAAIWRGYPWPRQLLLLDNDFFGNPTWRDRIDEILAGKFKISFVQGINARILSVEAAAAIASVDYRADDMKERRIYTAWDAKGDERVLFRGLQRIVDAGVKPDHLMVYMLIGHALGETHDDRDHRRRLLREFGARPYPMPFVRTPELVGFQRWVIGAYDKGIPWAAWKAARYQPSGLGDRGTMELDIGDED